VTAVRQVKVVQVVSKVLLEPLDSLVQLGLPATKELLAQVVQLVQRVSPVRPVNSEQLEQLEQPEQQECLVRLEPLVERVPLDLPDRQDSLELLEQPVARDLPEQRETRETLDTPDSKVPPEHQDRVDLLVKLGRGDLLVLSVVLELLAHLGQLEQQDKWDRRVPPDTRVRPGQRVKLDLRVSKVRPG
jgi:hypothetical protein